MAQTYHRWFLLPVVQYEETDSNGNVLRTVGEPKLVGQENRLDGFVSGGPFNRQQVQGAGYDHLLSFNDATEWRVVCAWGEGNEAWNALNEIHANYHDTATLADHNQDVAPVMDQRFGAGEWDVDSWVLNNSENTA